MTIVELVEDPPGSGNLVPKPTVEVYCDVSALPNSAGGCRKTVTLDLAVPGDPSARDFDEAEALLSESKCGSPTRTATR